MTSSRSGNRGFTLLELLAVIGIIAIILAIVVPSLNSLKGTALQSASRQVSSTLQLARQHAVTFRVPVKFMIATQTNELPNPYLVCRAYIVCEPDFDPTTGDFTGKWKAIQDWTPLPSGIVFSDLNNKYYDLTSACPIGALQDDRIAGDPPSATDAWKYFGSSSTEDVIRPGTTNSWVVSSVEFRPSGHVSAGTVAGAAAGIRLATGSVLKPSIPPRVLLNDTNNWVYIEYDTYSGRIRTRTRDSF